MGRRHVNPKDDKKVCTSLVLSITKEGYDHLNLADIEVRKRMKAHFAPVIAGFIEEGVYQKSQKDEEKSDMDIEDENDDFVPNSMLKKRKRGETKGKKGKGKVSKKAQSDQRLRKTKETEMEMENEEQVGLRRSSRVKAPWKPVLDEPNSTGQENRSPKQANTFADAMNRFLESPTGSVLFQEESKKKFINGHLSELEKLYNAVKENGGYYEIFGTFKQEAIFRELKKEVGEIATIETYKQYLFHYERYVALGNRQKTFKIEELNLDLFVPMKIRNLPETTSDEDIRRMLQEKGNEDWLLSGYGRSRNLDVNLFRKEHLMNKYHDRMIDVVRQRPFVTGFDPTRVELHQDKSKWTIKEYLEYQNRFTSSSMESIHFGVNIDALGWEDLMRELETKFHESLMYLSLIHI
eukprot:TRINITY_DN13680_c0_g1_i1.p1 TRINITY_DN13680_c0_g1~~TRINITY_DN13680_c0_g1_i1.p1  ORF type:complete len:408 (-),score=93.06 TRINITY_DN13680_c0_g1_i1:61-1284(-)